MKHSLSDTTEVYVFVHFRDNEHQTVIAFGIHYRHLGLLQKCYI